MSLELGNQEEKQLVAAKSPHCITKRVIISRVSRKTAKPAFLIDIWKVTDIECEEKVSEWDRIASGPKREHVLAEAEREHWKKHGTT